jgi:uncharacterized protein (DUF924 family)
VSDPEEILSYWFRRGYDADVETLRNQTMWWFSGKREVDEEIAERFAPVLEKAIRGELNSWADMPRRRLALIIVLDQFSRSVYRGTLVAYAQDSRAQRLALDGIDAAMDRDLTAAERLFFMLPLGHSENLILQERSVRYCQEEVANAPLHLRWWYEHNLYQAKGHREVIARFGRHPHRNEVLGRSSTPEELEYLRDEVPVHKRELPETPSGA